MKVRALGALAAAALGMVTAIPAMGETNTGVALIGASHMSAADRSAFQSVVSGAFSAGPASIEIAALPNEFNPDNPYADFESMARAMLASAGPDDHLRFTVYLWFHHSDYNDYGKFKTRDEYLFRHFNWSAFSSVDGSKLTGDQKKFRAFFDTRLASFNAFVVRMRSYAASIGKAGQFGVTLVPELEDTAPARAPWDVLASVVNKAQQGMGPTPLRRCAGDPSFRVGNLPQEFHVDSQNSKSPGKQLDALLQSGTLRAGDVFSLDGKQVSNLDPGSGEFKEFLAVQKRAIAKGVSVLWWRGVFNSSADFSGESTKYPALRHTLTPLGGSTTSSEAKAVKAALLTR